MVANLSGMSSQTKWYWNSEELSKALFLFMPQMLLEFADSQEQ